MTGFSHTGHNWILIVVVTFSQKQHRTNSNAARKFGTPLRSNTQKFQRDTQSTLKKKVRVRRTPLSKTTYKSKASSTAIGFDESAVLPRLSLFSPIRKDNPTERTVYLSPGPIGFELESVNCRVTRFVDGGPENPGQARKFGIKPGDFVLKVEAVGDSKAGTTYGEIVDILKLSDRRRIITVQSTGERQEMIPNEDEEQNTQMSLPLSSEQTQSETIEEPSPKSNAETTTIHFSLFDTSLPSLSFQEGSASLTSPIRNRTILMESSQEMPIIVPLGAETRNSPLLESTSKSMNTSSSGLDTSKSSIKTKETLTLQSDSDQFSPFHRAGSAFEVHASQVSHETMISGATFERSEHNDIEKSRHIDGVEQLQQSEKSETDSKHLENIGLFEDSIARAEYEQRLQAARREQSKTERESTELYIHTSERNQNKIQEFQVDRDVLQNELEEDKVERTSANDARIKELEMQVAEAEKFKMRTQVEAREKIRANSTKCSRLVVAKENEWRLRFADLENKIISLQEESDSRFLELNMSRTMVTEMESRIRSSEAEKEVITNRLDEATCSIQNLEDTIYRRKEEDEAKDLVIGKIREKLNMILQENELLVNEKESYETFKQESSVLTERLAKSVQEKQKAIIESQSIASKLNAENDDLMNQIAESTSDVEHLVEEKLLLEEKLVLTWKNVEKAKYDASRIHQTLLEKQENGEYFTSVDIEEKEIAIQALEDRVKTITEVSEEELIKSKKTTVILHLDLREAKRKLIESELLNAQTTMERDDWQQRSCDLEGRLADAEDSVAKMAETHSNEMVSFNELKARVEAASNAKTESDLQYEKSIQSLSSQLESKEKELQSSKYKVEKTEALKSSAIAWSDELKAELEGVTKWKEDADLQYQKSIESLTLQLESKRSELSSCEGRLAEMASLKKKQKILTTNLKTQLAALAHSKEEAKSRHQKTISSLTSDLEFKSNEFSKELSLAKSKEKELEEKIGLLQEEKEHLMTKYEDQIEALGAKLEIESQELAVWKETERKHQESIESLTVAKRKESEESQGKIAALTDVLQQQCEEYSCLELRSEILEDDYTSMQLAHEKAMEQIEAIKQEKSDIERNQEKTIQLLRAELESKQMELESIKSNLTNSIESLASKSEEATNQYEEEMKELKMTIESLKSEGESSSTEYWESVQELTTELQAKDEEIARNETITETLEEYIESMKIDIESSEMKIQEFEHEIFEKDILVGDLRAKIASQTELLNGNENEKSTKEQLISSLQSELSGLEQDLSDKLELQNSCDTLEKNIVDLETSKEKMSIEYCSEIFRFVKRLAILDQTHKDVNDQRIKAMSIAMKQRKVHAQTKSHVEKLEKELQTTSSRAKELENQLKLNLTVKKQKEHQVEMELAEKSKQIEHQNVMTSSLQAEVSGLVQLTKHLKEAKEREVTELKKSNENLKSQLSAEKESNARSTGDSSDARMELKMLDKKYSSMISSKDEALLKSEDYRASIARSLLKANAVVASLRVQLMEKDSLKSKLEDQERSVENLKQTNEKLNSEMEKMSESIAQNEQENEQLQQVLEIFDKNMNPKDKKKRLLKNIEDLSTKLVAMEESMKQGEILYKDTEVSLKKSISKLRAEYVSKHLETNELKKKIAVLNQDKTIAKKNAKELRITISNLQSELENIDTALSEKESLSAELVQKIALIENERASYEGKTRTLLQSRENEVSLLKDQLEKANSQMEAMKEQKKLLEESYEKKKKEMEFSLIEKETELKELQEKTHLLQNSLDHEKEQVKEGESNRESDAEKFSTLQRELLLRLEILEKEKFVMADTISRQEERLRVGEEKFNKEIAVELSRLREKAGKLEAENFAKTSSLAELNSTLESIRARFRDLLAQKNDLEERLASANNSQSALQEKNHEDQMHLNEHENLVFQLHDETTKLRKLLADNEESMSKMKNELQQLKDQSVIDSSSSDPYELQNQMSAQLSSMKDAFKIQAAVLEDVKLSESMLETLIKEVMNLATQSESEMLQLSSVLGTVDDLLISPSSLLSSLDLAGVGSSECYLKEIRSRLEDLAALAYSTNVDLSKRKNQLKQWMSNRGESPVLPPTPPSSKKVQRTLFDENNISSDITPVITDGSKEVRDKVAGARLLCCILENNNKSKLASAFRKWTCAASALNATSNASNHKETAVELAQELEITREKLTALKNHLKTGRVGKQKPRLRRILERLDGNVTNQGENMNPKTYAKVDDYSFEL